MPLRPAGQSPVALPPAGQGLVAATPAERNAADRGLQKSPAAHAATPAPIAAGYGSLKGPAANAATPAPTSKDFQASPDVVVIVVYEGLGEKPYVIGTAVRKAPGDETACANRHIYRWDRVLLCPNRCQCDATGGLGNPIRLCLGNDIPSPLHPCAPNTCLGP